MSARATVCTICDPAVPRPGDADMDRSVLSCCMQSPDFAVDAALQILKPDDFFLEACGLLFDVITTRHAKGELVDPVSLTAFLYDRKMIEKVGGPAFVSECYTASPNPVHVRHYAAAVLTASKRRQMARIATDLARAAILGGESEDWRDAVLPLLRKADACVMDGKAGEVRTLKEVAGNYVDFMDTDIRTIDAAIPTGVKGLDAMLVGGVRREYMLISAKSGFGKTLLAMQIAGKLATAGRRGLIVGYEMTALQILMRDIARETRVPVTHVMGREPFEGMEVQATTRGISRMMEEWDCHYIDNPYITLPSVAAHARTLHRQKPLDFIIADYLQIIPRGNHGKRRSDEILIELSTDLSRLQKELNCTLIAPLQVNAEGEIAEAKGIISPAQVYVRIEMIERDNDETGAKEGTDEGFFRVLKNRFGNVNRACPVFRNGCYQTFEDREHEPKQNNRPARKIRNFHT